MSSYERQPHIPGGTNCPTCRSHAAVFRAQLAGSRFYCARCRKTFQALHGGSYSTAFSLGPASGRGSLADTIAFVPDTKVEFDRDTSVEFDIRIEQGSPELPSIRLPSFSARRRAKSRGTWRRLGFGLAVGLGLAVILATMARATRTVPVAERPAATQQHLLR